MDSVFYIGSEEGVVTARSADGHAWEISARGLGQWEIPDLAVAPGQPNKVFAGTRGDGVWVSEDFGESWAKPCYGKRGPGKVRCVTVDPHDPKRIYAGTEPIDIFVSEDEGNSWNRLDAVWDIPFVATVTYPVSTVEPHVRDIAVDPTDPDTLYAALQVGFIVKSTDRGKSWRLLDNNLDCDVHTIAIDPDNAQRLLVATGGHDARKGIAPGRALYGSEDSGESWTPIAANFTKEYSVPLSFDPGDPNRVYSAVANGQPGQWRRRDTGAESTFIRSADGGRTWEGIDGAIAPSDFPEVIIADAATPGLVYTGCRSGDFYVSENSGETWAPMGISLGVKDIGGVALTHA
jgi:photosystem II stability/assembly factor-like uncharacterized protein